MRWSASLCALTATVAFIALATPAQAGQRVGSGIRGTVLYGPTCPVERVGGPSCVRPYVATLLFRRARTKALVARVRSSAGGHFQVRLPTGRYLLVPRNGNPYPHAQSQMVTVSPHRFTTVTVRFDSGIR